MNNTNNNISDLFWGEDKYISGLLIILANVIGFMTHFKKANFSYVRTYAILFAVVVLGSLLAHL
jgi:hypothetical protein